MNEHFLNEDLIFTYCRHFIVFNCHEEDIQTNHCCNHDVKFVMCDNCIQDPSPYRKRIEQRLAYVTYKKSPDFIRHRSIRRINTSKDFYRIKSNGQKSLRESGGCVYVHFL